MVGLLSSLLSTILLNMLGKLVTAKFLSALVESLILHALTYLKNKDLLKNTDLDEKVIDLVLMALETRSSKD